ncbi:DUF6297 family protein [Williamsia phyllosphaerae]|uniref:ABC transporter permease n=1 Tax=Williamsia phyllosphaerae TaxID=885042 RepID=A0ABQ1US04_9NOCA|nr:DUF6297 family protein [Williamsia phyllosphaerae]GGF24011.1 hypothetical protein GCM10007298_19910 [Williamsia phyllosphaerae]
MRVDTDNLPGVVMTVAVVGGLGWYLLQPERVSGVVGVEPGLGSTTPVLVGWTVASCTLIVGTALWWWGPIRLSRAQAVWHLSGPADRGPVLRAQRLRASMSALMGCLAVAVVASILDWSSAPALLGAGLVSAAALMTAASWRQHRSSDALFEHTDRRARRSVERLHRDVVAPDDGFIGAARLAVVTMDLGWLSTARVVRWELGNTRSRSRVLPLGRARACLSADLTRLRRRPGDLIVFAVVVAVGLAMSQTLYLTSIAPAVAAVLAYRAGCAMAGGLRRLTEEPALRRALGGSRVEITAVHSVVPVVAVLLWCGVASLTWHLSAVALVVVTIGSAVAVVRRATRPDLPFDAPVYVTGQGGAVQPLLLLAMARGPAAVVLTGLVATLIG